MAWPQAERTSTIAESDRNITDRELSLILRRAIQLQDEAGEGAPSDGLSIDVAREIAKEIGVEMRFVDQAAASVVEEAAPLTRSVLGGPIRERLEASYARPLSDEEASELVRRIRSALERQGEMSSSLGSVEWKTEGLSSVGVTISPRGDRTHVQIIGDRSEALVVTVVIPSVACLAVAGIIVGNLQPGMAETLSILGTGVATGLGIGRATWSIMSRSFRRRLEALRENVHRYMESAPGDAEGAKSGDGGAEDEG